MGWLIEGVEEKGAEDQGGNIQFAWGLGRFNPSTPHWLSRASVGLQLVLLCAVYSQARGCVCAALQLGGDAEQPWLMSKHDVIRKTGST